MPPLSSSHIFQTKIKTKPSIMPSTHRMPYYEEIYGTSQPNEEYSLPGDACSTDSSGDETDPNRVEANPGMDAAIDEVFRQASNQATNSAIATSKHKVSFGQGELAEAAREDTPFTSHLRTAENSSLSQSDGYKPTTHTFTPINRHWKNATHASAIEDRGTQHLERHTWKIRPNINSRSSILAAAAHCNFKSTRPSSRSVTKTAVRDIPPSKRKGRPRTIMKFGMFEAVPFDGVEKSKDDLELPSSVMEGMTLGELFDLPPIDEDVGSVDGMGVMDVQGRDAGDAQIEEQAVQSPKEMVTDEAIDGVMGERQAVEEAGLMIPVIARHNAIVPKHQAKKASKKRDTISPTSARMTAPSTLNKPARKGLAQLKPSTSKADATPVKGKGKVATTLQSAGVTKKTAEKSTRCRPTGREAASGAGGIRKATVKDNAVVVVSKVNIKREEYVKCW